MAELPAGITEKEIIRYGKLDLGIKKLQPEHKMLNEKIKTAFAAIGTWVVGNVVIKRTEANSFDAKAAEKKYPFDKFPEYYKFTFDPTELPADIRGEFTSKSQRLSVTVAELTE
jgi:hypothetical protein